MTVAVACALPDAEDASSDPIQRLATLAACAMRVARRAVEQYEALTAPAAQQADPATAHKQPDPGTLFTRAARIVLDCINKECRLLAGLPLAPARPRATPHADAPTGHEFATGPVCQAPRTVTRNHPHDEELHRQDTEQPESTPAAPDQAPDQASDQAIDTPRLVSRACAAAGIHFNRAQRRLLARDPVFAPLAAKPPAPD